VSKLPPHEGQIYVSRPRLDEDLTDKSFWTHSPPSVIESLRAQVKSLQKQYSRSEVTLYSLFQENSRLRAELSDVKAELNVLSKQRRPAVMTSAEAVYAKLRPQLESLRGKYVAIDKEIGQVVGVGDTIDEARQQAIDKTGKKQFYFRRVGQRYLFRL